jgi:hypothetical protein
LGSQLCNVKGNGLYALKAVLKRTFFTILLQLRGFNMKVSELLERIEKEHARSAWAKGVKAYAYDLIESLVEYQGKDYDYVGSPADKKELLNGADSWQQYSEGGCSLIYDADIAERLCSPSELKKTRDGQNPPNNRENWIDCQTRALIQAERLINRICKRV